MTTWDGSVPTVMAWVRVPCGSTEATVRLSWRAWLTVTAWLQPARRRAKELASSSGEVLKRSATTYGETPRTQSTVVVEQGGSSSRRLSATRRSEATTQTSPQGA